MDASIKIKRSKKKSGKRQKGAANNQGTGGDFSQLYTHTAEHFND
jgi:hypothetical protein